jgi:drug/metabolite transporter (DMT)-like permease
VNKNRLTAYGLLLITSIIWGVAGPVIKYTLADFPPIIFLAYRYGISAIVALFMIAHAPSDLPSSVKKWLHVFGYSIFIPILSLGTLFFGFDHTSSITGTLIAATGPVFVAIAGAMVFKDKISVLEKIGICLAIFGTIVTAIDSNGSLSTILGSQSGNLLILVSCVFTAIGMVYSKKSIYDHVSPMMITNLGFIVAFLFFLPLSFIIYSPHHVINTIVNAPMSAHLGVLYMAILSGTLGYFFSNWSEKVLDIGESAIFSYLGPIWAAPVAILLLGETITTPEIIGGCFIASGVILAEYRKRKNRTRSKISNHHNQTKKRKR